MVGSLARRAARIGAWPECRFGGSGTSNVRGLMELVLGVKRARLNRVQRIPERARSLTHTEFTLLRATATGNTNGEIAKERA